MCVLVYAVCVCVCVCVCGGGGGGGDCERERRPVQKTKAFFDGVSLSLHTRGRSGRGRAAGLRAPQPLNPREPQLQHHNPPSLPLSIHPPQLQHHNPPSLPPSLPSILLNSSTTTLSLPRLSFSPSIPPLNSSTTTSLPLLRGIKRNAQGAAVLGFVVLLSISYQYVSQ